MNKKKLLMGLKYPKRILNHFLGYIGDYLPDELYLSLREWLLVGYFVDFKHPKRLNEKIQWLKLYGRKDEYTKLVDKNLAKDFIAKFCGERYVVPTYKVWKTADEVNFDELPDEFVIKCNHNCHDGIFICHDKSKLDQDKVRKELAKALSRNYYMGAREYIYRDVERRIIAEKLLKNNNGRIPNDYKFHFLNGKLAFIYVSFDREGCNDRVILDKDWNKLPFLWYGKADVRPGMGKTNVPKPASFDEMVQVGTKLAEYLNDYIRIDFYDVEGHPYIGEITFYHGGGFDAFIPSKYDEIYGSMLKLPFER